MTKRPCTPDDIGALVRIMAELAQPLPEPGPALGTRAVEPIALYDQAAALLDAIELPPEIAAIPNRVRIGRARLEDMRAAWRKALGEVDS